MVEISETTARHSTWDGEDPIPNRESRRAIGFGYADLEVLLSSCWNLLHLARKGKNDWMQPR